MSYYTANMAGNAGFAGYKLCVMAARKTCGLIVPLNDVQLCKSLPIKSPADAFFWSRVIDFHNIPTYSKKSYTYQAVEHFMVEKISYHRI